MVCASAAPKKKNAKFTENLENGWGGSLGGAAD